MEPHIQQGPLGVVYAGAGGSLAIPAGGKVWVVVNGMAVVKFDAGGTSGLLAVTSATTRGTAKAEVSVPPPTQAEHNAEVGHINGVAGTGKAWVWLHFN